MLHKELRAVIWFQPKLPRIGATNWNSAESSFCGTGPDRTLAKHSSKDIGTDYHMHPQASPIGRVGRMPTMSQDAVISAGSVGGMM